VNERFGEVDARFDRIDARLDGLDERSTLESEQLYARMRVLHEELVAHIKILGEGRTLADRSSPPGRRNPKR
jgi:hypothetical protein